MVARMQSPAGTSLITGNVNTALFNGTIPLFSRDSIKCLLLSFTSHFCLPVLLGINQFSQMGMQSMGQRSTPPLPLNPPLNQVSITLSCGYMNLEGVPKK